METIDKVKKIIAEQLSKDVADISEDKQLVSDLGVDSLDAVEIIMSMEDEFGITISDEEGSVVKTVADVIKLVDSKLNK